MCVCASRTVTHINLNNTTLVAALAPGPESLHYPTLALRILPGMFSVFFCIFLLGRWRWNFERYATTTFKNTHTYSKNVGRIHLRINCYPAHICAHAHTNKRRERISYAFVTIHSWLPFYGLTGAPTIFECDQWLVILGCRVRRNPVPFRACSASYAWIRDENSYHFLQSKCIMIGSLTTCAVSAVGVGRGATQKRNPRTRHRRRRRTDLNTNSNFTMIC